MKLSIALASAMLASIASAEYTGNLFFAKAGKCSDEGESDPQMEISYPPSDGGVWCKEVTYKSENYGLTLDMINAGSNFPPKYLKGCSDSACKKCGKADKITSQDTGIRIDCAQLTNAPYVYIGDS
ncbi:hypothetical protein ASPWEDRAFT_36428, partial [Aspergillus wentii DTO 134E9]